MSLPAALSGQALTMIPINPVEHFLQIFNTNPYFIGIMMLVLNLGGRFINLEVTKQQELFLQHPWVRRILIFTVLFVATRNIWVAFWTTVTVVLFLGYLFNENSSMCLFGQAGVSGSSCENKPGEGMTPEEKEILHRLSAKAQRYQTGDSNKNKDKNPNQLALESSVSTSDTDDDKPVPLSDIYKANMVLLKQ
jgi:hypothetical protein